MSPLAGTGILIVTPIAIGGTYLALRVIEHSGRSLRVRLAYARFVIMDTIRRVRQGPQAVVPPLVRDPYGDDLVLRKGDPVIRTGHRGYEPPEPTTPMPPAEVLVATDLTWLPSDDSETWGTHHHPRVMPPGRDPWAEDVEHIDVEPVADEPSNHLVYPVTPPPVAEVAPAFDPGDVVDPFADFGPSTPFFTWAALQRQREQQTEAIPLADDAEVSS